ncbi:F-BAR and double SH3 domains protein 2 [Homalodisca vitripennis]|nr:F-BAR and double SH3 domains protein 2 [Homalodisca vitripennis]
MVAYSTPYPAHNQVCYSVNSLASHPVVAGNYAKFLKNLHAEQLAKLQLKNQNECELLDDIR